MKKALIGIIGLSLTSMVACGAGADGVDGEDGADGANGSDGADGSDGTDGTDGADGADGMDGTDGSDGQSCTLDEDADGNVTLQCGDETVTLDTLGMGGSGPVNGNDATSCTVTDNEDGSATISCPDGSEATVFDGADGMNGMDGLDGTVGASCSVVDNNDGSVTVSCPDGTNATVSDGADGVDGGGVLSFVDTSRTTTTLGEGVVGDGIEATGCVVQENFTLTVVAPTSGTIVVSGRAAVKVNHTSGTADSGYVALVTSAAGCPLSGQIVMSPFSVPANATTGASLLTVPVNARQNVSAGSHTFYMSGVMTAGHDAGDRFRYSSATAIFIPN